MRPLRCRRHQDREKLCSCRPPSFQKMLDSFLQPSWLIARSSSDCATLTLGTCILIQNGRRCNWDQGTRHYAVGHLRLNICCGPKDSRDIVRSVMCFTYQKQSCCNRCAPSRPSVLSSPQWPLCLGEYCPPLYGGNWLLQLSASVALYTCKRNERSSAMPLHTY